MASNAFSSSFSSDTEESSATSSKSTGTPAYLGEIIHIKYIPYLLELGYYLELRHPHFLACLIFYVLGIIFKIKVFNVLKRLTSVIY